MLAFRTRVCLNINQSINKQKHSVEMNSKNKGNTFERKIANTLSKRFQCHTGLAKTFRRNPDSGSAFGGINEAKMVTHDLDKACFGDIICPNAFTYLIECKHYRQAPSFASLLDENVADWDRWIAQATQDCINAQKKMAVVIKYNNIKEIVILKQLPAALKCILYYRDHYVVALVDFLALPDAEFFS